MTGIGEIPANLPLADGHAGHTPAPANTPGAPVFSIPAPRASAAPASPANASGGHGGRDFMEEVLGMRAYRQQLIASNIANADTPNYKAVDIDFQEALRISRSASTAVNLTATDPRHVQGQAGNPLAAIPLKYPVPQQGNADGNTVDIDVERAKFAENALMYEFSLNRVSGHFKHLMELLASLKD
ncbi:MAG: flagellar basal body rod protein FlgB [Betaproteobacteria bacterium]|nr:flagellar basal body rod protein FlgB [Betaproteobacteria bacterium]